MERRTSHKTLSERRRARLGHLIEVERSVGEELAPLVGQVKRLAVLVPRDAERGLLLPDEAVEPGALAARHHHVTRLVAQAQRPMAPSTWLCMHQNRVISRHVSLFTSTRVSRRTADT